MLTVEKAHEPISLLMLTIVLTETGREKESEEVREQRGEAAVMTCLTLFVTHACFSYGMRPASVENKALHR